MEWESEVVKPYNQKSKVVRNLAERGPEYFNFCVKSITNERKNYYSVRLHNPDEMS